MGVVSRMTVKTDIVEGGFGVLRGWFAPRGTVTRPCGRSQAEVQTYLRGRREPRSVNELFNALMLVKRDGPLG
jgi:hypothetical protein